MADWAIPISDIMLNAASATVDYQMRALVSSENYVRFQVWLGEKPSPMDDVSAENLRRLDKLAKQAVRQQSATIDRLCRILEQNGPQARAAKARK